MSWERTLDSYGELIEERLKGFFNEAVKEARGYHPFVEKVYAKLEEFVLRSGKRMASCSTLLTYKGYTGNINDNILNVCAGIELYRHCILVHDDLVDMDDLRRDGKTVHRTFMENYDRRFGAGTAVFIGNIAYALAMRAILGSGFPEEKITKSLLLLSKSYQEVNESQILDLLFEYKTVKVNEWGIMASKRAASLFKVTMLMGAILGGASENNLRTLEKAAVHIGYAFDIQDDIIDTFAQEEQYGRPTCGDVATGKKPLHIVYALNSAHQEKSRTLREILGKKPLSQEERDLIRSAIRESGGLEAAKKTSKKHAEEAKTLIAKTGLHDDVKEFFNSLIFYKEENLDWYK
jgi:geranylgeranyl diphosphate synthase type II